jgi:hypothetical protein
LRRRTGGPVLGPAPLRRRGRARGVLPRLFAGAARRGRRRAGRQALRRGRSSRPGGARTRSMAPQPTYPRAGVHRHRRRRRRRRDHDADLAALGVRSGADRTNGGRRRAPRGPLQPRAAAGAPALASGAREPPARRGDLRGGARRAAALRDVSGGRTCGHGVPGDANGGGVFLVRGRTRRAAGDGATAARPGRARSRRRCAPRRGWRWARRQRRARAALSVDRAAPPAARPRDAIPRWADFRRPSRRGGSRGAP